MVESQKFLAQKVLVLFLSSQLLFVHCTSTSGKTTLALHIIAEAQKVGKKCTFIDAEHALNPAWAQKLGVNIDRLLISQPDSGEQALEIADTLIRYDTRINSKLLINTIPTKEIHGWM